MILKTSPQLMDYGPLDIYGPMALGAFKLLREPKSGFFLISLTFGMKPISHRTIEPKILIMKMKTRKIEKLRCNSPMLYLYPMVAYYARL